MSQGYTLQLRDKNLEADDSHVGVRLGRICIERGVSVIDVAERFKVSRTSVYNWFAGVTRPSTKLEGPIERYISELEQVTRHN